MPYVPCSLVRRQISLRICSTKTPLTGKKVAGVWLLGPEKRKVHSKNFYGSMLTSNGKDGRVVVAIDDRHAMVGLSSLATPDERLALVELAEELCKFLFVCGGPSRRRSIPEPEYTSPYRKRQSWSRQATSASWKRESVGQTRPPGVVARPEPRSGAGHSLCVTV